MASLLNVRLLTRCVHRHKISFNILNFIIQRTQLQTQNHGDLFLWQLANDTSSLCLFLKQYEINTE